MKNQLDFAYSLDCFEPYGINVLTSEACGYGGRLLCNLDSEGCNLLTEFLGGWVVFTANTAWGEGVSSIMLPHSIWADLAVFILIRDGHRIVVSRPDYVVTGYTEEAWDEIRDRHLAAYPGTQVYANRGTAGTRNRHEFSGRIT